MRVSSYHVPLCLSLMLSGCSGSDAKQPDEPESFEPSEAEVLEAGRLFSLEGSGSVLLAKNASSEVELRPLPNAFFSDAGALLSRPMSVRLNQPQQADTLPFVISLNATNALQGGGIAIVIKTEEDGGVVVPTEYIQATLEGEDTQRECVGTAAGGGLDCKPIWTFTIVADYMDAAWAIINLPSAGRYPDGYEPLKHPEEVTNLAVDRQGPELRVSWRSSPDVDTLIAYREGTTAPSTCGENQVVRIPRGIEGFALDVGDSPDVSVRVCSFFSGLPVSQGLTATSSQ